MSKPDARTSIDADLLRIGSGDSLLAVVPKQWRLPAACILTIVTAYLCIRCSFYAVFTGFYIFDDEGAMLLVLAGLSKGHTLYDQLSVMYGPVGFFPKVAILKLLHLDVSHNVSRSMSWIIYSTGCIIAGGTAWRITRQIAAFPIATFITFFLLRSIGSESGHPQDLCQLLIVLGAFTATFTTSSKNRVAYMMIAFIGGLLAMTKGNLGAFYLAALGAALVVELRHARLRMILLIACVIGMVTVPYSLISAHIAVTRIFRFFIFFEATVAATFIMLLSRRKSERIGIGDLLLYLGVFALTVGAVIVGTMLMGTSLHGMADGLVYLPLRGSRLMISPWRQTDCMIPMGIVAVSLALCAAFNLRSGGFPQRLAVVLSVTKVVVGLVAIFSVLFYRMDGQDFVLATTFPFIWMILLPVGNREVGEPPSFCRIFLAFLAITEMLGSYPNAGAQQSIALILPLCILIVCIFDGWNRLTMLDRDHSLKSIRLIFHASLVLVVFCTAGIHELGYVQNYKVFPGLPFAGSEMIHVYAEQVAQFRTVVATLKENCDSFMTVPGMNSFYLWAGMSPPTDTNTTNWLCLTDQQQKENYAALQSAHRPAVLFNPSIASFWNNAIPTAMDAPIVRWINQDYHVLLVDKNWIFLFPKARNSVKLVNSYSK